MPAIFLGDTVKTGEEQASMTSAALELYRSAEAGAVQGPFVILAVAFLVLAFVIRKVALPRILEGGGEEGSLSALFANRRLMAGAAGIFVYVGAEVALGSYMVNYGLNLNVHELMQSHPFLENMAGLAASIKGQSVMDLDPKGKLGVLLTFYWGGAMVGRFIGAGLMQRLKPSSAFGCFLYASAGLVVASSMCHRPFCLALVVGGGPFQFDHVPHDFHAGNC